jgi:hypothetical protein
MRTGIVFIAMILLAVTSAAAESAKSIIDFVGEPGRSWIQDRPLHFGVSEKKSGLVQRRCPLFPQKRTLAGTAAMSALCQ